MSADLVLTEQRGAVLVLTLNRPDRLNAWNNELEDAYFAILDAAEDDPSVRALVLTGSGRGFCAGADLANLSNIGAAAERSQRLVPRSRPWELDKPLIAAINGAAVGLGLVQALYCDVRFCAPAVKLGTAFVRRGLIAEYGITHLLDGLVGPGVARDLLLSGRIVTGTEALALGLVERVVAPEGLLDAAVAYARDLAENSSPRSMAVIKRQLRAGQRAGFSAAYGAAEELMLDSFSAPDVKEGVASHLGRRAPEFAPLPSRDARADLDPSTAALVVGPQA